MIVLNLCACGCNSATSPGRLWLRGHHGRGKPGKKRPLVVQKSSLGMVVALNAGYETIVDEIDIDLFTETWTAIPGARTAYVMRQPYLGSKEDLRIRGTILLLHRAILARALGRELLHDEQGDHINGDGLDNRRCNLRAVSAALNLQNRPHRNARNKSGFRGVRWRSDRHCWESNATFQGRHIFIGSFASAKAADLAARQWRIANMPGYIDHKEPK